MAIGNTATLRTLSGAATDLSGPTFVAVTTSRQPIAVPSLTGIAFHAAATITYGATLLPGTDQTQANLYPGASCPTAGRSSPWCGGVWAFQARHRSPSLSTALPRSPSWQTCHSRRLFVPFSFTFGGAEPRGTYFAYAGLAIAGSNSFQPANQLSPGIQAFQFNP